VRKIVFLALTLLTVVGATLTLPRQAEAACAWQCGLCGTYCPCDYCKGPLPLCPCG
jgi:hypothetical protein